MSDHQTLDDKLETLRTFIEDNKDLEEFLAQSRGFADSQVQQAQRSERQAWRVAYAGGGLAVIAMLTVMGLTPLKTVTPSEVLVLDKSTGATSALQKLEEVIVSEEDVIMRKGINDFMRARELHPPIPQKRTTTPRQRSCRVNCGAGFLLAGKKDVQLGTLRVLDPEPRQLNEEQVRALHELASIASEEIMRRD